MITKEYKYFLMQLSWPILYLLKHITIKSTAEPRTLERSAKHIRSSTLITL